MSLVLERLHLYEKDGEEGLVCAQRLEFSKFIEGQFAYPQQSKVHAPAFLYPQSFRGQKVDQLQLLKGEAVTYLLNNGEGVSEVVQKMQVVRELAASVATDTQDLPLGSKYEQSKCVFAGKKSLGKLVHLGIEVHEGLVSR